MVLKRLIAVLCSAFLMLAPFGCARYKPSTLPILQPEFATYSETIDKVTLSCKALSKEECKRYFDRDIIGKGYQPVQVAIDNNTEKHILFSAQSVSLPICSPEEVANKCHTNTAGRAAGYTVAGLFLWPFLIPAVVDGVKSSNANAELDRDFEGKSLEQVLINPHSNHSGIIFISNSDFQDSFSVKLVDRETHGKYVYRVKGLKGYYQ